MADRKEALNPTELTEQAPEPVQDEPDTHTAQASQGTTSTTNSSTGDARPTSVATEGNGERQQAEATLIEAFPGIEAKVVKAVLVASGGNLEQAFNALLGMSDPNSEPATVSNAPPTPQTTAAQRQMQQDEMYARQLAQHYQTMQRPGRNPGDPPLPARPQSDRDRLYGGDERERNFFDDDLPEIKEGVRKTFLETQSKFNTWWEKIQKKIDGDDQDPYNGPPALDKTGPSQQRQRPEQKGYYDKTRRSGDTDAFDADPQVIGDDFQHLELRDDYSATEGTAPALPGRPAANPNLFKPTPPTPPQPGPVDEVDAAERKGNASGGKSAKWQPLTTLEPKADTEENDPFSVGDDGDDDPVETSVKDDKTKDIRAEDSARLKKAASQSESTAEKPNVKELKEHEKGSVDNKDKTAEALLTGDPADKDTKEDDKN